MRFAQHVLQLAVILTEGLVFVLGISGEWSAWSEWSTCSVTCGYGTMKRQKTWVSPRTEGADERTFKYDDIHECSTTLPCPIDGHWNFWGPWSSCTAMCDGGVTVRERECNNPVPRYGGRDCEGKRQVTTDCNEWKCPELPPNFDITTCNQTTFMCLSQLQCIPLSNVCDDSLQCHDGSDEHECKDYIGGANSVSVTAIPAFISLITSVLVMA